ncbi:Conserved_hypothetical protein [Hexamita inflata]|uniref:RRM domain-containing protein n=1 Tax=Hexamita inflata TaxID=28002 RepID=A0AA86U7J3_9EUKA|nr:Conserved hypothetical protein [Hexamita inflata]
MADDFEFVNQEVTINNSKNLDLMNPTCLPENGPYTIQMRDLTFAEEALRELFEGIEVNAANINTRPYDDPKRNITVYTYQVTFESRDDAAAVLGMNGQEWEGCNLNARFWVQRNKYQKREEQPQSTVSFKDMKKDRGTVEVQAQVETNTKVSFNRAEFGSVQNNAQPSGPVKFNRAEFGTQKEERREERKEPVAVSFKRSEFGTGIPVKEETRERKFERGTDKKETKDEGKRVTLDFGRK